ncbi:MAG TPA: AraC family transcriptional regulator [Planctomycetota bacterium]|nr:AraC family transcriptional regulator [Planctomycetota bacterium]
MPRATDLAAFLRRHPPSFALGFTVRVDWTCALHGHPDLEIVYHPTGRGRTTLSDGTGIDFAPGDVVIYPPHLRHAQRMSELGDDCCLQLRLPTVYPAPFDRICVVRGVRARGLIAELRALAAPQSRGPLARLALDHRAGAVLAALAARMATDDDPRPDPAAAAMRLIAENAHAIDRVDTVARAVGLSADRLRHVFKARYGFGVVQALTEARIARAKELLARTSLPLAVIAGDCGFANARWLCTVFRRVTGTTPAAWRRSAG